MDPEEVKKHIIQCFEKSEQGVSKITDDIIAMEGMTGTKTRHFYNNLLSYPTSRYLEIGTWRGSSVCSAMCGNNAKVVCIDNWSEFYEPEHGGNPKNAFLHNFNKHKGNNDASFIEQNCFTVDVASLPKFNIYMYDGNHTYDSHYNALVYFYNCLDDIFVFIIDDWNWRHVQEATYASIKSLNIDILYEKQIITDNPQDARFGSPGPHGWHNGMYVAVLKKNTR